MSVHDDWQGCMLVNPLCPDDLCLEPAGHSPGKHQLGTMRTDAWTRIRKPMYVSTTASTSRDLIEEGWDRQQQLLSEGKLR